MKCLRRYFCVLLCCALCLGGFSVSVSAASSTDPYEIYQYHKLGPMIVPNSDLLFTPNNGKQETVENTLTYDGGQNPLANKFQSVYRIQNVDKDHLFEEDSHVNISFTNIYFSLFVERNYTLKPANTPAMTYIESQYISDPDSVYVLVKYADGTEQSYTDVKLTHKLGTFISNVDFSFTPEEDVEQILFYFTVNKIGDKLTADVPDDAVFNNFKITFYAGEFKGDDRFQFDIDVQSEEAGLLESILNFIIDFPGLIWDIFSEPFETIFGFLGDIFDAIIELPKLLWELIEAGLKALFVPSDEFIVEFKQDMDTMLSQKLGAVYQVIDIMGNSWDSITANDVQNVIHIPETTIPLGDNSFSFGGYDVPIVPSGFEFVVDILKTVIGISATVLFVNGLRKKYDDVIGGK